jgi:hypothetical protein
MANRKEEEEACSTNGCILQRLQTQLILLHLGNEMHPGRPPAAKPQTPGTLIGCSTGQNEEREPQGARLSQKLMVDLRFHTHRKSFCCDPFVDSTNKQPASRQRWVRNASTARKPIKTSGRSVATTRYSIRGGDIIRPSYPVRLKAPHHLTHRNPSKHAFL